MRVSVLDILKVDLCVVEIQTIPMIFNHYYDNARKPRHALLYHDYHIDMDMCQAILHGHISMSI